MRCAYVIGTRNAMMCAVDQRDAKRVMHEMRALLMKWDAVGVADVPDAADEYDCMVGPLFGHLHRGASAAFLCDWIARERADHFGLTTPDPEADAALAASLIAWRDRRERS